jgi:ribosomal-protein-serine acetyltransferase
VLTVGLVTCNILDIMNITIPDPKATKLTDGAILLRPFKKHDAEDLYLAVRSSLKELGAWLPFAHENYSLYETKDWVRKTPAHWKKGSAYHFAICDMKTGEIIGVCGLNAFDEARIRANLGYWIRTDRTGQGIAVVSASLLAKWGFEILKLKRIEILVAVDNSRSLRVAEKAGATREGVLRNRLDIRGKLHDAVMHSLIPGEI